MSKNKKKVKKCKKCGKPLCKSNKSGFCSKHIDRTGKNNPFFGKHHTDETKNTIREKNRIISTELWKNDDYKKHVKDGLQSEKNKLAHTSDEFRKKQSENAKKQMKDPVQLEIRSESMKKSWKDGKIVGHPMHFPNFSKSEIEFGNLLKKALGKYGRSLKNGIFFERLDKPNYYFKPDFVFKKCVIEFDGDFWHARNFDDNEIVHHDIMAKEIREIDKLKTKTYKKYGYKVFRVWYSDFKNNKEKTIQKLKNKLLNTL